MIKINLGLKNNPFTNKEDILEIFNIFFITNNETLDFKIKRVNYMNPEKKQISEDTAIFNVHLKSQKNKKDIDFSIKKLCSIFKQDSISYYSESLNLLDVIHNIRYIRKKYTFDKNYFKL